MVLDEEALERMLKAQGDADTNKDSAQAQLTDQTDEFEVYERPTPEEELDVPPPALQPPAAPATTPEPATYEAPPTRAPTMDAFQAMSPTPTEPAPEPTREPEPQADAAAPPTSVPNVVPTHAPEPEPQAAVQASGVEARIAIVHCRFNHEITDRMVEVAKAKAEEMGSTVVATVQVAGVFDSPLIAQTLAQHEDVDAVVVVGVVVKGDTDHDQVITQATCTNLQRVALDTGVPVGLAITGPGMSWAEAEARIGNAAHAVEAVVEQVGLLNG